MSDAQTPSSEAFITAYDAYSDAIYRHCYFRVSHKETAEELMQDTFMRTWDYLSQGKEIENIRAFLYHVANNLIINHYKKRKTSSLDELQETGFDPASSEDIAKQTLTADLVAKYLSHVDSDTRDLLVMRYIDEMGPTEIAEVTGLTENVISVRLHRGLQKVRTMLHDE